MERSGSGNQTRTASIRQALDNAERASEAERRNALNELAGRLDGDAGSSGNPAKMRMLSGVVRQLAAAPRLASQ
jgi:hypothetical protein